LKIGNDSHFHFLVTCGGLDAAAFRIQCAQLGADRNQGRSGACGERLEFIEPEGRVGYRIGCKDGERESMDYLEFIARVTSHIPDKGQVMVRYYGLYSNAYRGRAKKGGALYFRVLREGYRPLSSKGWAALIRKAHIGQTKRRPDSEGV